MKRWQLIVFMLLATATWTATGPVSADEKCYDNKGNPIPCPPTKEEPSPTKGGSATADRPPATKTPKSTLTPTPSPKWTPPPLASTETGTPSATLTQSVIIAASTNPPDEVYTPPPRPCIPWLQIVLGALGGLFTGAALTIGTMGFTLFQQNGSTVRANVSPPRPQPSRHYPLRGRPLLTLPAVISSVWFRVGIITIGIALSAAALTNLNSLAPCNDWPAAAGISAATGIGAALIVNGIRRSRRAPNNQNNADGSQADVEQTPLSYAEMGLTSAQIEATIKSSESETAFSSLVGPTLEKGAPLGIPSERSPQKQEYDSFERHDSVDKPEENIGETNRRGDGQIVAPPDAKLVRFNPQVPDVPENDKGKKGEDDMYDIAP